MNFLRRVAQLFRAASLLCGSFSSGSKTCRQSLAAQSEGGKPITEGGWWRGRK